MIGSNSLRRDCKPKLCQTSLRNLDSQFRVYRVLYGKAEPWVLCWVVWESVYSLRKSIEFIWFNPWTIALRLVDEDPHLPDVYSSWSSVYFELAFIWLIDIDTLASEKINYVLLPVPITVSCSYLWEELPLKKQIQQYSAKKNTTKYSQNVTDISIIYHWQRVNKVMKS